MSGSQLVAVVFVEEKVNDEFLFLVLENANDAWIFVLF